MDRPDHALPRGIWIPKEIWDDQRLTWMQKCLLAVLEMGGCSVSNEELSKKCGVSPGAIAKSLVALRKLGFIQNLSFNGRIRVMKLNHTSKAGFTKRLRQPSQKGKQQQPELLEVSPTTKSEQVSIPSNLNTPEFLEAWGEWKKDRRARKKPMTARAEHLNLLKLAAVGPEKAIQTINISIEKGWVGLFPEQVEKVQKNTGGSQPFNKNWAIRDANKELEVLERDIDRARGMGYGTERDDKIRLLVNRKKEVEAQKMNLLRT